MFPFSRWLFPVVFLLGSLALVGCGKVTRRTEPSPPKSEKTKPTGVPTWLGNPERNFFGTGPWGEGPLEIIWEFKTSTTSGRLHKDPWGGTSWPGQPSLEGDRVYFPSADGNTYCLNRADGSVIWKFKAKDSFKATPTIAGTRIIASPPPYAAADGSIGAGECEWGYWLSGARAMAAPQAASFASIRS